MQITDLPKYVINSQFELICEGSRLWVNSYSGLLARYGPTGTDIHSTQSTCLFCQTGTTDFDLFVDKLYELHNINLRELTND